MGYGIRSITSQQRERLVPLVSLSTVGEPGD